MLTCLTRLFVDRHRTKLICVVCPMWLVLRYPIGVLYLGQFQDTLFVCFILGQFHDTLQVYFILGRNKTETNTHMLHTLTSPVSQVQGRCVHVPRQPLDCSTGPGQLAFQVCMHQQKGREYLSMHQQECGEYSYSHGYAPIERWRIQVLFWICTNRKTENTFPLLVCTNRKAENTVIYLGMHRQKGREYICTPGYTPIERQRIRVLSLVHQQEGRDNMSCPGYAPIERPRYSTVYTPIERLRVHVWSWVGLHSRSAVCCRRKCENASPLLGVRELRG